MRLKIYQLFIILFSLHINGYLYAQTTNIQFFQEETRQPVQYANVSWQVVGSFDEQGNTISDIEGKTVIPVKTGSEIILSASCVGCRTFFDTILVQPSMKIFIEEDVLNLEQVTVTGTRTPHILKRAPVLTQLISENEIKNVDSETITDILEVEMPGVEMANHGGVPVMNMMGLETQYSLVLIDGERMAKSLQKTIDYSRINTANIQKIEIVRGASSALYGSDAMGGVINIITKKPVKDFQISADVRYQERNSKDHTQLDLDNADDDYARDFYHNIDKQNVNANLSVGFREKDFYSNTFLNYKAMDGYRLFDTEGSKRYYDRIGEVVVADIDDLPTAVNGFKDYTVNQQFGYEKGDWKFNLGGSFYEHDEFDFTNDALHQLYRSLNGGAGSSYSVNESSSIALSHNSDIYKRFKFGEKEKSKTLTHNNAYHTSKLTYTNTLGKHRILAMIENLYQTLETDKFVYGEVLSKSTNDAVLVLQDEFQLNGKLSFVGGLRAGLHSAFDFHASPSVTAKYSMGKFNLRTSYARGFRSPDLKELYMNWSHMGMFQIIGNEDLKPETNNYYAFSVDFVDAVRNLNATVIASYNDVKDKIDGVWTNNETEFRYVNFSDAQIFSIEALVKWRFHKNFKFKTGYIFLDNKKSIDAQDLSTMSPMSLTGQLEYRYSKKNYQLNVNLSGKFTGEKEFDVLDSDDNSPYEGEYYKIKYPDYALLNLTINQYFGKNIKLGAGLKNIFNYTAPIVTFNTSNTSGRKFFVSIGYQL